jgi:heat shock protein HslJ
MIKPNNFRTPYEAGRPKKAFWQGRSFAIVFAGIAAIQLATNTATGQMPLPAGLESPDQGVVCNPQRGICYDRYGPSIGLTEGFLGKMAAERLGKILHGSGNGNPRATTFSPADGVECVRKTGPCRLQGQKHGALTAVMYGPMSRPAGQTAEMRAIMYGEWHWQHTRYSNDNEARPKQPERYVLRFEPHGVLSAKVDCNMAGGKYRFEGNQIVIELINSTLMACEPDSLEQVFQQNLAATNGYFMKGGQLFLGLKDGAGAMEFDRPALTAKPGPRAPGPE